VDIPFAIETSRLKLRWLELRDADFIYQLVHDPHWLRFIGDKQVADLEGARGYIEDGPRAMYRQFGFGLNRVALKDGDTPIGICGLLQWDSLPHPAQALRQNGRKILHSEYRKMLSWEGILCSY